MINDVYIDLHVVAPTLLSAGPSRRLKEICLVVGIDLDTEKTVLVAMQESHVKTLVYDRAYRAPIERFGRWFGQQKVPLLGEPMPIPRRPSREAFQKAYDFAFTISRGRV